MSRYIEVDKISRGIEVICKDERSSISAATYFEIMAFINKMSINEAEPLMTNSEKLRNMPIDDLLKSIQEQAEKFDVCIMTLLPGGRILCPWHNDCDKCLQEWLNEEDKDNA